MKIYVAGPTGMDIRTYQVLVDGDMVYVKPRQALTTLGGR
jgi:hypothetical protein